MDEDGNDGFQALEEEHKDINNNLAVPSYRVFCNEFNLPFHFWDELPETSFDPEIANKEMRLHTKAMKLFNKLKPEVVFFKGNIIRYQCQSWDGANSYNKWPIDEYLEETSDELFYLKNLEKRFETISSVFCLLLSLAPFLSVSYLLMKFIPQHFKSSWLVIPGIVAAVFFFRWLHKAIWTIPKRILDEGRLEGVEKDLNSIRKELADIQGTRPNPLGRRLEIIIGEWQTTKPSRDIDGIIQRVRAKLYVVARRTRGKKSQQGA